MKEWPKGAVAIVVCRIGDPYYLPQVGEREVECWQCGAACLICPYTELCMAALASSRILCVECARAYYDATGQQWRVLRTQE